MRLASTRTIKDNLDVKIQQYFIPCIVIFVNVKKNAQNVLFDDVFVDSSLLFRNIFTITSHFQKLHFLRKNLLINMLYGVNSLPKIN